MALELSTDLILGLATLGVAVVAIFMFMRATDGVTKKPRTDNEPYPEEQIQVNVKKKRITIPELRTITKGTQVSESKSKIRTLTLQQEVLGMVMKRLFEAEDEGEISKPERERLSKNYETELKQVNEDLTHAELIVSLNELEEIRTTIIQQFQETLNNTQEKIDLIIGELNIPQPEPEKPDPEKPTPKQRLKRRRPRPQTQDEETTDEEEGETGKRETVEDRLDKLKQDVLKELEELDRLELEA